MPRPLPGDHATSEDVSEAIRVNHAGEYGAQRIYEGQLAILKNAPSTPVIREMKEQEIEHLETFERYMKQRHVRPSALLPFWHVAGWALGAGTALMGEKAAMACTVAVESVITEHYGEQLDSLSDGEEELKSTISQFLADEQEHHDIGLAHEAERAPGYGLLSAVIKSGCRAAVAIAKRV